MLIRKIIFTALMSVTAIGYIYASVEIDSQNFIVRQQWPWSSKVVAEFTVGGEIAAPGAVATVKAYDGDELICEVPGDKLSGDVFITTVGRKRLAFDPAEIAALKSRGVISSFRLGVEYVDGKVDFNAANILYVVFDLEKEASAAGKIQVLTESDITGGSSAREGVGPYGAWKRRYWDAGADTVAWLGVNDPVYKTTKMVFRHVPSLTFTMGSPESEPGRLPNEAYDSYEDQKKYYLAEPHEKITLPGYYIGVFEVTQKQWSYFGGEVSFNSNVLGDDKPAHYISYQTVRGVTDPKEQVAASSYCGGLAAWAGDGWKVDLPSEAQWEAACRAGTSSGLYDGTDLPSDLTYYTKDGRENIKFIQYAPLAELANTFASVSGKDRFPMSVGTLKPNNYGLYDMLGNVGEFCLDKVKPENNGSDKMIALRGGSSDNWISCFSGIAVFRAAARAACQNTDSDRQLGFRVVLERNAASAE